MSTIRMSHKRHKNDNWVDGVSIDTIPRWKESELSGDEWRFSYRVKLWRKGHVVKEQDFGKLDYASSWTTSQLLYACPADQPWPKDAPGGIYGDGYFCDNVGCSSVATWRALLKATYCRDGHRAEITDTQYFRVFCDDHKPRGDCGLEDSDDNYVFEPIA